MHWRWEYPLYWILLPAKSYITESATSLHHIAQALNWLWSHGFWF